MSSFVLLTFEDSSDWTVPIYSFTSYFCYRSVTNVAASDLLPDVSLGGSGGLSNSFLVAARIFLICLA